VIERGLVLATGDALQPEDIRLDFAPRRAAPATNGGNSAGEFLAEGTTLEEHERQLIREALKRANGNKSQAARLLGLTRNALRYRLTQMGLE
jgi:DNA-binding NtrC family response regulator